MSISQDPAIFDDLPLDTLGKLSTHRHLFTLIKPEYPYNECLSGYVYERLDAGNRKYIVLNKRDGTSAGTTYARYLMSIHLKRMISADFAVDHINNDCTDDRIENYQLLTTTQNSNKGSAIRGKQQLVMLCPVCQNRFIKPIYYTHFRAKMNTIATFCGSRCSGKCTGSGLSVSQVRYIGNHQTLYSVRTHWFEYEDWYHEFYPHTEILQRFESELLSEDGTRCRDIPGLTEFCWDIFTPNDARGKLMIALAEQKLSLRKMSEILHMDRKLIAQYLRQERPDLVKTPKTEELRVLIRDALARDLPVEQIAVDTGLTKHQVYDFIRYHKLADPGTTTVQYKAFIAKVKRIKGYQQMGLSTADIARKELDTYHNMYSFINKWQAAIDADHTDTSTMRYYNYNQQIGIAA